MQTVLSNIINTDNSLFSYLSTQICNLHPLNFIRQFLSPNVNIFAFLSMINLEFNGYRIFEYCVNALTIPCYNWFCNMKSINFEYLFYLNVVSQRTSSRKCFCFMFLSIFSKRLQFNVVKIKISKNILHKWKQTRQRQNLFSDLCVYVPQDGRIYILKMRFNGDCENCAVKNV